MYCNVERKIYGVYIMDSYERELEISKLSKLENYKYISENYIEELDTIAVSMEHKKTKARILLMLTDDNNKVFTIGFRTPSIDSTGVAHILEHSVLCGSRKFPLKDPFVELVKGSLNTFLNAMTYMDKTLYPVASCNDKDFQNLMDVYLDAVFYPNVYKEEKIFLQEGWHYELEDKDKPLTINGVVYNEMKGAFSSSDAVLERAVSKGLFPNHSYGEESGGDPKYIPKLSYKSFLDFHQRYYHPSNSFIYLYGDMDMVQKLDFIDKEYLSGFEYKEIDSSIKEVEEFTSLQTLIEEYSISDDENIENSTYLSLHAMVGGELDPIKSSALKILDYLLISSPGAIIKEALQKASIGDDILGGYEYGIAYPYFSIIAKNTNIEKRKEFLDIINKTLEATVKNGLDKEKLEAAINLAEFKAREADFGSYPKGLIYGLEAFNSWLYDANPCMNLEYNKIYKELRYKVQEGYFEKLIQKLLIYNKFKLELILKPVKNLTLKRDNELKDELAKIKEKLSEIEIAKLIENTKALKEYQASGDSKENISSLPVLKRSEINKKSEKFIYEEHNININNIDIPVIYSNINTSGISYMKFIFDIGYLSREDLQYLSLLKEIFAYVDTNKYTYSKLDTLINLYTGGLSFSLGAYTDINDEAKAKLVFNINIKALSDYIPNAISLAKHIIFNSKLDNLDRIKEIIFEIKSTNKSRLLNSGHISALTKAGSFITKEALFENITRGLDFYKFIEDLALNYESKKEYISEKLKNLLKIVFNKDNLYLNFTGHENDYDKFILNSNTFIESLTDKAERSSSLELQKSKQCLAYTSASMVSYAAQFGNYKYKNFEYNGVLRVLKVLLSYDYLWNNIRVMGGAYGAMASFTRNGSLLFTSYRDPKTVETYNIYDKVVDFIKNFEADDMEIDKLVIGAISELDTPLTPYNKGLRGLGAYFSNMTNELVQKERNEILNTKLEDIRGLADMVAAALCNSSRVCIGNEEKIKQNEAYFDKVEALYKD